MTDRDAPISVQDATGKHIKRGILEYGRAAGIQLSDITFEEFYQWADQIDSEERPVPAFVLSAKEFERMKQDLMDTYGEFARNKYDRVVVDNRADVPADVQCYPTGDGYVFYRSSEND